MNLAEWAPAIITVIAAIFTAGAVVGRIKDQELTIKGHDAWLKDHEKRITTSEAWRDGFAAGKRDRDGE
jgi:hypothetical protein